VAELVVEAREGGSFAVEVRAPEGSTHHVVRVPDGYPSELGCQGVPAVELVRRSFEFLLEREPPSSILRRFELDDIERYFPEYPAEIRRRCSGLAGTDKG